MSLSKSLVVTSLAALGLWSATAARSDAGEVAHLTYYPIDQRPEYLMLLNGTWKFNLGKLAEDFSQPSFDDSAWKSIKVPGNWNLEGFGEPGYGLKGLADIDGLYRRSFTAPASWKGRRVFLRFESAAFGFEFWVNGKRVGEFASAFNRSEFDVTDFIEFRNPGTLAVRVTNRLPSWEMDTHDDWSLPSIQRDVVLFSLPEVHLKDYTVTPHVAENKDAAIAVNAVVENSSSKSEDTTLNINVVDPQGKPAGSFTKTVKLAGSATSQLDGSISIPNPQLWTAETPTLYTLNIDLLEGGEHVHLATQRIGLREIKVENGVFKINGAPVKLHGVNHHDLHPDTGRVMTREQYVQDLELMTAANVNAIRMCHYPPQKLLLDLCDEYGIYVLDEIPFGGFDPEGHLSNEAFAGNRALGWPSLSAK